jgi:hypothetical protein
MVMRKSSRIHVEIVEIDTQLPGYKMPIILICGVAAMEAFVYGQSYTT